MQHALTIADLRQLVAARFPNAPVRTGRHLETGIAAVDDLLGGGLETGTFTEVVSDGPSCGGQLFLSALIRATRAEGLRMALVDAANGFDADFFNNELLAHMVWFRGEGADASLKLFWQAADLVVRDNNFGLVVLDLRGMAARELRRTPVSAWYRLQRAIEQAQTAVVVQSDTPLVPCAARRLVLAHPMSLSSFKWERAELVAALLPEMQRERAFGRLSA